MLVYWKFRSRERVDRLGQAEFQGGVANAGAIVGETFEQFLVGGGKGAGGRREDLEDPGKLNRVDQVEDGNGEDGAHAELLGKSISVSSEIWVSWVRRQTPERPSRGLRGTPRSGARLPVAARHTNSSPRAKARAPPLA